MAQALSMAHVSGFKIRTMEKRFVSHLLSIRAQSFVFSTAWIVESALQVFLRKSVCLLN